LPIPYAVDIGLTAGAGVVDIAELDDAEEELSVLAGGRGLLKRDLAFVQALGVLIQLRFN
jgi:hypothetical protein